MEWICKISNDSILLQYQCACCMCIEFSCRKSLSTVSSVQLRASEWNCRLLFSSILSFVRFGLSIATVKDSFVVFGMYCMLHRWQFVDLCYVTELTSLAENFFAHIQRLPCSSSIHTNSIVTDEQRIRQGRRKGRRIEKSKFELRFLPHSHSHISCCNNSKMWYTAMNSPTIDPCASFNTWNEVQYSTIHQMNSMQKLKTPQRSHLTLKVRQHTKSCTSFLRLPNSSYRPPSFTRAIFGWFDGLVSYCYCCCCHYIRRAFRLTSAILHHGVVLLCKLNEVVFYCMHRHFAMFWLLLVGLFARPPMTMCVYVCVQTMCSTSTTPRVTSMRIFGRWLSMQCAISSSPRVHKYEYEVCQMAWTWVLTTLDSTTTSMCNNRWFFIEIEIHVFLLIIHNFRAFVCGLNGHRHIRLYSLARALSQSKI